MPLYVRMLPMHRVVALALPQVVAFDLAIPAQVFGHGDEGDRYAFSVCSEAAGLVLQNRCYRGSSRRPRRTQRQPRRATAR